MKIEDKRKKQVASSTFDELEIGDVFEFMDKNTDDSICIKIDAWEADLNYYSFKNANSHDCANKNELVIKLDATLTINKNAE